jgi:hypothetical protein
VIERAFAPEIVYEFGDGNIFVVLQVKHTDSRRAYLAVRDWDGHAGVLVSAHSTYTDAVNSLKSAGMIRMDDYVAWEHRFKS